MEKVNLTSMIITLIGALNTASIAFGVYHLDNGQLQAVDTIVSVIATLIGVVLPHRKGGSPDAGN